MSKSKILILDIETRPALAYVWRLFDENVGLDQLVEPSSILSVGWKWLGKAKFEYADVWPVRSAIKRRKMLRKIHKAMSQADAVVTFNGNRFDLPKLRGEFLQAGFAPLHKIASVDVIETTKQMGYTSNKLAHVAPLLGCDDKTDTGGFKLWREYMDGSRAARASMRSYNKQDVLVLEQLYKRVRPYIRTHVHIGAEAEDCPNCGSTDVSVEKTRRTRVMAIDQIRCHNCGACSEGKRRRIVGIKPKPEKHCPDCGETKAIVEFCRNKGTSDGRASICKACAIVRVAAYRKTASGRESDRNTQARMREIPGRSAHPDLRAPYLRKRYETDPVFRKKTNERNRRNSAKRLALHRDHINARRREMYAKKRDKS